MSDTAQSDQSCQSNLLFTGPLPSNSETQETNLTSGGVEYLGDSEVRGHTSCERCQSIPWEEMIRAALKTTTTPSQMTPGYERKSNNYAPGVKYVIHENLQLFRAAADNCEMCCHLWNSFQSSGERGSCLSMVVVLSWNLPPGIPERPYVTAMFWPLNELPAVGGWQSFLNVLVQHCLTWHPISKELHVASRAIPSDPSSPIAIDTIKGWISNCLSGHKRCDKYGFSDPPLPTRVLQFGASRDPNCRLVITAGKSGRFVALSHCWGHQQPFTTTTSTLKSRLSNIQISDLPATYQDAIKDDPIDWQLESAKMASVYKYPFITIAASRVASDTLGFLQPRSLDISNDPVRFLRPPGYRVSRDPIFQPTPGVFCSFGPKPVSSMKGLPLRGAPLSKRAWVIQERYLAHQTIFFDKKQMYWECDQIMAGEDGDVSSVITNSLDFLKNDITTAHSHQLNAAMDSSYYCSWYDLVSNYGSCDITYGRDRLPALAGLAAEIASKTQVQYLAGLWGDEILIGLCWERGQHDKSLQHPPEYQAPSWSWASVDGTIAYLGL
ncbi:hypothetical protein IFR05_012404 [Cadophora sp. M221]|nr:hypothetical protein IFR05_012404 [Cadophora sp. M221]